MGTENLHWRYLWVFSLYFLPWPRSLSWTQQPLLIQNSSKMFSVVRASRDVNEAVVWLRRRCCALSRALNVFVPARAFCVCFCFNKYRLCFRCMRRRNLCYKRRLLCFFLYENKVFFNFFYHKSFRLFYSYQDADSFFLY